MPGPNEFNDDTSLENFDVAGAAAEIGASLFPKDKPEDTVIDGDTGKIVSGQNSNDPNPNAIKDPADPLGKPQAADPNLNPNPNPQSLSMPKAWKKEKQALWDALSPEQREYITHREADVVRGLTSYQAGYNNWGALIQPFLPMLQANPTVNPIQLMQGLMNTHLTLLSPETPLEQKVQLVNALLAEYGISLQQQPGTGENDPNKVLLERLSKLETAHQRAEREANERRQSEYEAGVQAHLKTVLEFASKNKYFEEVQGDIHRFLQSGAAADLAGAYELACLANPVVRVKFLADQAASAANPGDGNPGGKPNTSPQPRARNGQFLNVDGDAGITRKPKPGTIENTIDGVVAKHYPGYSH